MNVTINPFDKIAETPTKDSVDRRHIIWRCTKELFEILCAGNAETVWREWFHPCSGYEHPPQQIDGVTHQNKDLKQDDSNLNERSSRPRSRDFYFQFWVIPVSKSEYGVDVSDRLTKVYDYIKRNYHYARGSDRRIWDDSRLILEQQDELSKLMVVMSERMYSPRLPLTNIRPLLMTYEEKTRLAFAIVYVLIIVKVLWF